MKSVQFKLQQQKIKALQIQTNLDDQISQLRRKSCECSDCGKSNMKSKRLDLTLVREPRTMPQTPKKSIPEVKTPTSKGYNKRGSNYGSRSNESKKNVSRFGNGKKACLESQRLLFSNINHQKNVLTQQINGYKPLGVNLKKFLPSMYHLKNQMVYPMIDSKRPSDITRTERAISHLLPSTDELNSARTDLKSNHFYKLKSTSNQKFINLLMNRTTHDKENLNPQRKVTTTTTSPYQQIDKYYCQRLKKTTHRSPMIDSSKSLHKLNLENRKSPNSHSNYTAYLQTESTPISRERINGVQSYFPKRQFFKKRDSKNLATPH